MEEGDSVETHLTENEEKAQKICDEVNEKLENWESAADLNDDNLQWALEQFEEALQLDELCLDAYLGKAYVLGLMDKTEEATSVLETAKEIYPEDPRITEMLAMIEQLDDSSDDEGGVHAHLPSENTADVSKLIRAIGHTVEPLPRFKEVLDEIWARFNKHNHGKVWEDSALDALHRVVNGTPMPPSALEFLREHFDVDSSNRLTQEGFIGFYVYQTATDGAETWKDLAALGYDKDLNKIA